MKKKFNILVWIIPLFLFVFTVFYSSTSKAGTVLAQTSECRWSSAIDGNDGDFYFCGYYSNPLHCNCGDIV